MSGRYSRQELFAGIGREGQARLAPRARPSSAAAPSAASLAETMARAGVGALTVVDRDFVEQSNLQRQALFDESDVAPRAAQGGGRGGAPARAQLRRGRARRRGGPRADNAGELLAGADVVLDGTDNFETRFLLNDVCVRDGVPWVYGACVGAYGLAMAVRPRVTPCLRCLLAGARRRGRARPATRPA